MQEEKKPLKNAGTLRNEGKVLPQEPVDIFALPSKSGAHLGAPGTKHTVHAVLAKKLIDKGAATQDEGAAKKAKPAKEKTKLSAKELKALTEKLGHEPSDEEIAAAIEEKEALD